MRPHPHTTAIGTDREDVSGPAKCGDGDPARVWGEGDVLDGAGGVSSVQGVQVVDCREGRAQRVRHDPEQVEVVSHLVGGEEDTAAGVPGHRHNCLGVRDKMSHDTFCLGVTDVNILSLLPAGKIHHVQNCHHSTVHCFRMSW